MGTPAGATTDPPTEGAATFDAVVVGLLITTGDCVTEISSACAGASLFVCAKTAPPPMIKSETAAAINGSR